MSNGFLLVRDSRTTLEYRVPIQRNSILATAFKDIKAPSSSASRADKVGSGLRVHDPGLLNTTVVETGVSFADGERDLLLFRGYSLEQLWQSDYEDMLHLMVWDKYPTPVQKESLRRALITAMLEVPKTVFEIVSTFPSASPPMPMVVAGLAAYLGGNPDMIPASSGGNIYQGNIEKTDKAVIKTIAAYAVVVGMAACHRKGIEFTAPSLDYNFIENLFHMSGMVDDLTGRPDAIKVSCFRRFAALNMDHGMALAVFSTMVTASSLTDPISCLIASLAAAYGPLHFGATEAAHLNLRSIGDKSKVPEFISEVKQGKRKLFGYGHRTYKGTDPRVKPIKELIEDSGANSDPLIEIAKEIERLASNDDYFTSRGLHPNADFYGNFVFTAVGFQSDFIPIAMISQRLIGIMAHWREAMVRGIKLFRPSHIYTGDTEPVYTASAKL
ncbi:hypothetical protein COCMIDRAFT_107988 [Bipolaris oryzae ATCC 44560]|uniref:Citrate synthase n=1 Tax=Bipolaris oryzae ATCC 44560 TaxID=930090 RepID=W6YT26_COCMI|nr:uncharacterized protein COCMIDRAFT_107988 [Bipolaris oryzae ATCC 44560]EUC40740.1 hypothetical protein COCMIDRAFT_107988 [Bipolaris oryzae ATCC 44560]